MLGRLPGIWHKKVVRDLKVQARRSRFIVTVGMSETTFPTGIPGQTQPQQPGIESEMNPNPIFDLGQEGSGKLKGKVALITGGDSGIGRATAIAFAREGADVAISYLNEHEDAKFTSDEVERLGRKCHMAAGDVGSETFSRMSWRTSGS